MGQHVETLVIGAGPAGLSAAHVLARAGRTVSVLEQAVEVGGAARTLSFDGFDLEASGRRLASSDPTVRAFWASLLPEDLAPAPSVVRLQGQKAVRGLPGAALGALLSARLRPIAEAGTLEAWLTRRFGRRAARRLGDYAHKLWALRPEDTLALPARARFQAQTAICPRGGAGRMWTACADAVRAAGGEIILGTRATGLRLDRTAGIWTVTAETDRGVETFTADQVISTMPLRELMAAISPMPISLFHACELMYRDQVTVAFEAAPGRRAAPALGEIHDPAIKAARARALSPDGRALALDYYCFEGDALWAADDAALVAQAQAEAQSLGLIAAGSARAAQVVRQRKVHPIHDDACDEHLKMIGLDLRLHCAGLHLAGRAGTHGDSADDQSVRSGLAAASTVLARAAAPARIAA